MQRVGPGALALSALSTDFESILSARTQLQYLYTANALSELHLCRKYAVSTKALQCMACSAVVLHAWLHLTVVVLSTGMFVSSIAKASAHYSSGSSL